MSPLAALLALDLPAPAPQRQMPQPPLISDVAASRAFVVELISYDRQTGVATVRTPDDEVVSVCVHSDLRRFASTRQPGDRILVAVEEAVAVNVVPAA